MPNAGSTRNAWSSLDRNARPTNAPAAITQRVESFSRARVRAYAPSVMSRVNDASGLLNRNISAATGVSAHTAPASRPAPAPNHRLTAA